MTCAPHAGSSVVQWGGRVAGPSGPAQGCVGGSSRAVVTASPQTVDGTNPQHDEDFSFGPECCRTRLQTHCRGADVPE